MSKYTTITVRIPTVDIKDMAEIAVEYALEDYTDEEIRAAGVDTKALAKRLVAELDWGTELGVGIVDHVQDLAIEFGKNIVYRRHKILQDAIKRCEKTTEAEDA